MPTRRSITVLVESSRGYGRGLLQGIAAYVREHGPWTIHNHERRLYDAAPDWLKHWHGDGIIARIASPQLARQIARLHVPTVDLLGLQRIKSVPAIIADVVQAVQISRSTLKRRFAAFLRRSPQEEIRRVQVERVTRWLDTTNLPLLKIAEQTGFRHVESMCKLFKRKTGLTPGQHRKMWSEGAAPTD